MNLYSQYINSNLRYERIKENYSCKEMAKKLGFNSTTSYYNIEKGITKPNIIVMNKIAQIFNKPVSYFFNLEFNENEQRSDAVLNKIEKIMRKPHKNQKGSEVNAS